MNALKESSMVSNPAPVVGAEICETTLSLFESAPQRIALGAERGEMNPEWIEWWMGWPAGWTELRPLATDRFRQWSRSHGNFLDLSQTDNAA